MSTPSPNSKPAEPGSALQFSLCAILVTAGLGIVASHAPARIRLLGLFSLGFGLLTGWLLSSLAGKLNVRLGVATIAVIGLVTVGGLITSVCGTVAQQPAPAPVRDMHPVEALVAAQMRKAAETANSDESDPSGPTVSVMPALATPASAPDFASRVRSYLHRRVEMLGDWTSPWPEVFWGVELLAGTAGSVWMALRGRHRESRL